MKEWPIPAELVDLVSRCEYRNWSIWVEQNYDRGQGCAGPTLLVQCFVPDSYAPDSSIAVLHLFPIPVAAYNRESWQRWLFDQILLVERHEAMEHFLVAGERPYAPNHGPGWNPYLITSVATDVDRRTDFRGQVAPGPATGLRYDRPDAEPVLVTDAGNEVRPDAKPVPPFAVTDASNG